MATTQTYNPLIFGFEWNPDGSFTWNQAEATKAADDACERAALQQAARGYNVVRFQVPGQVTRAYNPRTKAYQDFTVTCFGFAAYEAVTVLTKP